MSEFWQWYMEVGVWNRGVEGDEKYFSGTVRSAARAAMGCCMIRVRSIMMLGENAELYG